MNAEIGIIGGSGFYEFLTDPTFETVSTPFGEPSAPIAVGELAGRRVAFVPRHGRHHEFPPHRVNYRANLWALRSLGVRQVLAPCAVGSLRPELGPGSFVVPDQLIDRTWGRAHTVYDSTGPVVHVSFADPYCPRGRATVLAAADDHTPLTDGGTLVVINGPRFSTRAESQWHAAAGGSVVGMTGAPEASVARELALCYTTVCMVTDHDAGVEVGEAVTHAEVLRVFADNIERLKGLLRRVVATLPAAEPDATATCSCRRALDGMALPLELP
ncbi:MAG: S-methyl-5'-thioadenosine phosphorylase [Propionicimonas sp.]|uniref:S-methyl-5'-thioadenosine phosphorylase n=1 Tax=Propionicimonas sp. TaxID=1955623 RepID=UPI002B213511|nr:S-methyl-5'-thioadenosine phosphorylase [Propionicimonas sp.]MEA4945034.1 S-methyl-5'-thioadenosine phosphorylase [Propionicimonas sp.]MEA5055689.1 S-methyl-5'-thioadenosine phosphorylase [Propionicimonas sp.]MEA5116374.1 S-methyl-5'-thioadenosine phosphorylase [Propionicimonas sp.]